MSVPFRNMPSFGVPGAEKVIVFDECAGHSPPFAERMGGHRKQILPCKMVQAWHMIGSLKRGQTTYAVVDAPGDIEWLLFAVALLPAHDPGEPPLQNEGQKMIVRMSTV